MYVIRLLSSKYHIFMNLLDGADKGIIPLTCSELFTRLDDKRASDPNLTFTVEVSYIEVRSLAAPGTLHLLNLRW